MYSFSLHFTQDLPKYNDKTKHFVVRTICVSFLTFYRAVLSIIPWTVVAMSLAALSGLSVFAFYSRIGCDPLKARFIRNPNQVNGVSICYIYQLLRAKILPNIYQLLFKNNFGHNSDNMVVKLLDLLFAILANQYKQFLTLSSMVSVYSIYKHSIQQHPLIMHM